MLDNNNHSISEAALEGAVIAEALSEYFKES
jgi:hypothetical protein